MDLCGLENENHVFVLLRLPAPPKKHTASNASKKEMRIFSDIKNVFGTALTTVCYKPGSLVHGWKLSSSLFHRPLFTSITTLWNILFRLQKPLLLMSVCLFIFFHLTPLRLFRRKAQCVIAESGYCWQSVTFRWESTMTLQVTFIHCQAEIRGKYSVQVLKCCQCWAVVKSLELKINQSANSQMNWLLIPKLLALFSTFPEALLMCFEIISLDFDMLL